MTQLSKVIQQLEEAEQNKSGMFELGEETMCALTPFLVATETQEPVGIVRAVNTLGGMSGRHVSLFVSLPVGTELYTSTPVAQPVAVPDWHSEADQLAALHGLSFVVFRHGEQPQCADPTKVMISFTDKGLGYNDSESGNKE